MKERKRKLKPFVMPMVYALAFTALVLSLSDIALSVFLVTFIFSDTFSAIALPAGLL